MVILNKVDLDLDALKPKPKTVRLNGEIIEIYPISLDDVFELQVIVGEFENKSAEELSSKESFELLKTFRAQLETIVPDLSKVKCTLEQLMAIIELAFETAAPGDQKELKKRGITPKDRQKKALKTTRS